MKTAKVLWFCQRDGNGIIKDKAGREYYVDTSVTPDRQNLRRDQVVSFTPNLKIKDCRCAIVLSILFENVS